MHQLLTVKENMFGERGRAILECRTDGSRGPFSTRISTDHSAAFIGALTVAVYGAAGEGEVFFARSVMQRIQPIIGPR